MIKASFSFIAALAMGCGGDNGQPAGITITLSRTQATVDVGASLLLTAQVANDPRGGGVSWALTSGDGQLRDATATSVTYVGPAAPGAATVSATAVNDPMKTVDTVITVVPLPTVTLPEQIPTIVVGQPYSYKVPVSGGSPPFTFAVTEGHLPNGLALDATSGVISGIVQPGAPVSQTSARRRAEPLGSPVTPGPRDYCTPAGDEHFVLGARDSSGNSSGGGARFNIAIAVTVDPILHEGAVGVLFSAPFSSTGGICPITWQLVGAFPDGLQADAGTDTIAGKPTAEGSYEAMLQASDSEGATGTAPFSVRIVTAVSITTSALPAGVVGSSYDFTLDKTGANVSFVVVPGSNLPPGLTLEADGRLHGTPMAAGSFSLTVCAFDPTDPRPGSTCATSINSAMATFTIVIDSPGGPLAISTTSLPFAKVGTGYSGQLVATGGTRPFIWFIAGTLPSGLMLVGDVISGTPTGLPGTYRFDVTVTDASLPPQMATATVSLELAADCPDSTGNADLDGDYAFLFNGFNSAGGQVVAAGQFNADKMGQLTSGLEILNGSHLDLGGSSYCVGADDRGELFLGNGQTFAIALGLRQGFNHDGSAYGRLIEIDGMGRGSGFLIRQDPSALGGSFAAGTSYAFGLGGHTAGGAPMSAAGVFTVGGTQLSGEISVNQGGTLTKGTPLSGNVGSGAVTWQLSGTDPLNGDCFVVDETYCLFVNGQMNGEVRQQVGVALDGDAVFYLAGVDAAHADDSAVSIGQIQFTGSSPPTFIVDSNIGGRTGGPFPGSANVSVEAGRIEISDTAAMAHLPSMILYRYGAGSAFALDMGPGAGNGKLLPQTTPIADRLVDDRVFFGDLAPPVAAATVSSGIGRFDEVMSFMLTKDVSSPMATTLGEAVTLTLIDVDRSTGRIRIGDCETPPPVCIVGYEMSNALAVFVDTGPGVTVPVVTIWQTHSAAGSPP